MNSSLPMYAEPSRKRPSWFRGWVGNVSVKRSSASIASFHSRARSAVSPSLNNSSASSRASREAFEEAQADIMTRTAAAAAVRIDRIIRFVPVAMGRALPGRREARSGWAEAQLVDSTLRPLGQLVAAAGVALEYAVVCLEGLVAPPLAQEQLAPLEPGLIDQVLWHAQADDRIERAQRIRVAVLRERVPPDLEAAVAHVPARFIGARAARRPGAVGVERGDRLGAVAARLLHAPQLEEQCGDGVGRRLRERTLEEVDGALCVTGLRVVAGERCRRLAERQPRPQLARRVDRVRHPEAVAACA